MASTPTVSDLRKVSEVTAKEITAAVDAVLAGKATEAFPLSTGWKLNLVELIRTNHELAVALASNQSQWKRGKVRTSILLAHPVKG